jgi:hypothetical protein
MNKKLGTRIPDCLVGAHEPNRTKNLIICRCGCIAGVDVHIMLPHYFSRSCGPGADPIKSALGHVTSNLCFCIRCDMWIT